MASNRVGNVPVLTYNQYSGGRDSQTVYGRRYFCGSCRRGLGGVYGSACFGHPEYPEDLEAKNESPHGFVPREPNDEPLEWYAFCPWCGVQFEDEWWNDRVVQNERVIDHYKNPGWHASDTHEFRGSGPDCMAGHWLGVSGGDKLCWCEPEVTPSLMGCVIRHQDKRYEDYVAEEAARKERELAERRARCVPMALPDDHDSATCDYCEDNAYDVETCETCQGSGCEDCEGHGEVGYSW